MSQAAGRGEIVVRPLEPRDLSAALAIQAQSYPPFLCEGPEAFASRVALPASYCLAAEEDEALIGYLLAHGWTKEAPPPVGAVLQPAARNEVLFIHDLSVSARGRGRGVGRALVERALQRARDDGLLEAELIAVGGAAPYWRSLGFAEASTGPALRAKVGAYGPAARWMRRALS